ncbi:CAAX protease self-immunity [Alkalibacterium subtropicum]|uniref:CAAX protease self-immunity n=1 Tax=Alkalibacterium subtropicum TaxID=753702 RepID=A0A1I1JQM0_9LACT|nr:CPBP family intramembrane glutamic endopeptidase [Alkalibacterium subtropicum]SFC50232.1 CAAX protease self-immunity [Alkalibacterium subtropicum]
MYQKSFKHASLWGLLGWTILSFISVTILTTLLLLAFAGEHVSFVRILSDSVLYFLVYKIVISQMKKQALSVDAVAYSTPKNGRELLKIAGWTLLIAIVATSFSIFLLTLVSFIPNIFDRLVPYLEQISTDDGLSASYLFVIAVIVAPIVEEVVFRGYIMNKWVDKYSVRKGIIFSSLLFMIFHFSSFFIPQLLLGLLCALVYVKYRNLFYAIFTHSLYNFLVILPALLVPSSGEEAAIESLLELSEDIPPDFIIFSVIFIVGLFIVIFLFARIFRSIKSEQSPYADNLEQIEKTVTY